MTLSICIIAKNEAHCLRRALDSIKNISDQIVIIDTGSTDETKEIAKEYTNEVYDFEWTGSFSDARNYAKSFATKDWILSLDCDEAILDEIKVLELINDDRVDSWTLVQSTPQPNGSLSLCNAHRLFRNLSEIKWKNRIHETIDESLIKNKLRMGKSLLKLVHLEKNQSEMKSKFKWYIKELKKDYDNPMQDYYIGICNICIENYDLGAVHLYESLKTQTGKGQAGFIHLFLSDYWLIKENISKAIEHCLKSLEICPEQNKGYVALAGLYSMIDEFQKALDSLDKLLEKKSFESSFLINDTTYNRKYLLNARKWIQEEYNEKLKIST